MPEDLKIAIMNTEILTHFRCSACEQWWSIADFKPNCDMIYCPVCGKLLILPKLEV